MPPLNRGEATFSNLPKLGARSTHAEPLRTGEGLYTITRGDRFADGGSPSRFLSSL